MAQHNHDFTTAARKATNVSLDSTMVSEAKRLGVNISRACEAGLAAEIAQAHARQWKIENSSALASSNEWVERNGLPLARYRQF
ncbi:MAG: post-segregation antitoxin CcdA [Novosphingobium sp.]|nr:post-segregation antitoxin CcdA [Novosphingobium sp.]